MNIQKAIERYGVDNLILIGAGREPWATHLKDCDRDIKDLELMQKDLDKGLAKLYINSEIL